MGTKLRKIDWQGARVEALDRRRAAMHEAGHFVVAWRLGLRGCHAEIVPSGCGGLGNNHWVGRIWYRGDSFQRMPRVRRAMFGVAGMVAEEAWALRNQPGELLDGWWDDMLADPGCMSERDWECAGCVPGEARHWVYTACERVARLFDARAGSLWAPLLHRARKLTATSSGAPSRDSDSHPRNPETA